MKEPSWYNRAKSLFQEQPAELEVVEYPSNAGMPTLLIPTIQDERASMSKRQAHVAAVSRATGWTHDRVRREMDDAASKGVPYHIYRKNKCWTWSPLEIEALGAHRREREDAFINEVRAKTGCSEETAWKLMRQADKSRLKRESYLQYHGWNLTDEELEELAIALKQRRERKHKDEQHYIDSVCHWSGWPKAQVYEHMVAARELGIPFNRYVQFACWTHTVDELEQLAKWLETHAQENRIRKERYIESVCEETGWTPGKVHLETIRAQAAHGASYEDYFGFKLHRFSLEEQGKFVTLHDWNLLKARMNNNQTVLELLNDKAAFNRRFAPMIKHVWFTNRDLSLEEFLEKIQGLSAIVVKPVASTQGKGISKHPCNQGEQENRGLYHSLMEREESIVEGCIEQHSSLAAFCPESVNTLRVTTLCDHDECRLLYAILRMGVNSPVDNFHAGGIAAGVNTQTGMVETNAIDLRGNAFLKHPVSGKEIRGFQVPHWDQVVQASHEAAKVIPDVGLIGWDFAITPEGVDLIEGNGGSGYVAVQMIYAMEGVGLRKQLLGPWA